ncbi:FAD-dependent monooxygenase [Saccharothrix variisporea]|uniref:2-polyprenyl-6-methoxyphenol hydroxylase-like FAD-dependent oxidoreductase n=1 Tax=Saccharothrix variisporea TaxID=543527 RepID=A0A495WYH8_9PSEU|nr:FAD-dependent monooxygenase [Saccharothrix variisporea]RKT66871.1 2-polyprenyl-6-methoxyphenol hydroxylase-like FAD-dependent oxidoreductase [Saccharothrix variisporea]
MPDTDVLVVGAGPTGLLLANELALAGVDVVVAEQRPERSGQSRALSLQPRSAEILDLRGWLDPIAEQSLARLPAGHFAGMPVHYGDLDTRFPYQLGVEQSVVEAHLEGLLGAVARGHVLVGLEQDEEAVTAAFDVGGTRKVLTARYLVGADGGHSTVRKLVGAEFPGRAGRVRMAVADITLASADDQGWRLPSFGDTTAGFRHLIPLREGRSRLLFAGPEQQELARDAPVTAAEVQRALGDTARVEEVWWASRFTDASRQAARYRHGRVLLAGDAAHIHLPIGGQGLNLGLGDAFNLGWKLAAHVTGRAPAGLLDTYHAERHPVAAAALASARAQGVLTIPDEDVAALRGFVADLISDPATNRRLAEQQAGLDVRYAVPGAAHPLLGLRMPDVDLPDGTRLNTRFREGRSVLLDTSGRFDHVVSHVDGPDPSRYGVAGDQAVLIRPDGHVCWIGDDEDSLRAALAGVVTG